ncbi:MAG: TRAP transporter substrate-binding protein [Alphaproteobacteria bacterium]
MAIRQFMGAAVALAIGGLATGATAQTDIKIGFATINDPQHAVAEEIKKRLDGKMGFGVRVFPAGQVGSIPRMIEGIQFGTLEMLITPPGFLVGINPNFQVPDAPGIFDDVQHAHRALNDPEFYAAYSKLAAARGINMTSLYVYGPTSFASKKPIRTLADLKGQKVRVLATKMESALVGKFGAAGVPMPYTEVLPGLQRGTIDAVRSSIIVMGGSKFFTVTKYITVVESGMIPSAVMVSEAWLKKLSADQRKFVEETVAGISQWATDTAEDFGKRAEKLWKDNGAEVIRLSAAEQKQFMDTVRPLGDEFLGGNNKVKDMYNLLKKAVARTRK